MQITQECIMGMPTECWLYDIKEYEDVENIQLFLWMLDKEVEITIEKERKYN